MSGRQVKVVNEQAQRYGLPIGGAKVDLAAFVRSVHDFFGTNGKKISAVLKGDADPLMSGEAGNDGPDSPALERYREIKADLAELDLEERRGTLIDANKMRDTHSIIAKHFRAAGETLRRQYGEGAALIMRDALDAAEAESLAALGDAPGDDDNNPGDGE